MQRMNPAHFWGRVDKDGPIPEHNPELGPCWIWTGGRGKYGYGKATNNYRTVPAHRIAWEFSNDAPIPEGMWVLHRCDNPPCVRPEHLRLGTAQDNTDDMIAKGRNSRGERWRSARPSGSPSGEAVHNAKLTDEVVRYIRARFREGDVTSFELARELGVHHSTVRDVKIGRRWRHVV